MQRLLLEVADRPTRAGALICALACLGSLASAGAARAADLPPSLEVVIRGIFDPPHAQTAADVVAEILRLAGPTPTATPSSTGTAGSSHTPTQNPSPTGTGSPTPSFTPGSPAPTTTPTVTGTPTLRACPPDSVTLELETDNFTAINPVAVRFTGTRDAGDCLGGVGAVTYDVVVQCGAGKGVCASVGALRPGSWVHSISVFAGQGQLQYRRSLLTAGAAPERQSYVLFPRVAIVQTTDDAGAGSLRSALQAALAGEKPMLIQFSPQAFPPGLPTSIVLASALPSLAGMDVTVDAIDATGARGNRIVDANRNAHNALSITGSRNHVIGLRMRNAGNNDRDVLSISGTAATANLVEDCIVDTSATGDAIGITLQAGTDFASSVNVIRNCEVFGAADKGVKVTTGSHARIENCWVHANLNGGIQSALGGNIQASENVVEDNRGSTAQNGLAVLGADDDGGQVSFSVLESRGNVSRRNGASGMVVRQGGSARVRDDYLGSNTTSGLRVFNDGGAAASAVVQGTSAVCNGGDGAVVGDTSFADFGGGPMESPGHNAFTQNNLPQGFENFRNITGTAISATDNQWEHCGRGVTCNEEEIRRLDLNDDGLNTLITPAQAQRDLQPVLVAVSPSRGRAGELLRVYGTGFNAIDGHFAEDRCGDVTGRNTCVPLRGNCVQIDGISAPIEAVTPTMLVARWPFTCTTPVSLVVKVDQGSTGSTSPPITVCE